MAQDSIQKKERQCKKKKKKLIHIRKSTSNPEKYKHLKAVSKIQIQIYAKKKKNPEIVFKQKKKIETYTTPNRLYISEPAKRERKKAKK